MVSQEYVDKQLKELNFNTNGWGRSEVRQLPSIILPDEKIFEVVNGIYEGGFALLLATDIRVLLVDKKLMSFLTVEDLRFDMINEIDYNHRLVGSYITIATGNKTLTFRSYNKARLRKLIGHVQNCMAENKKKQSTHDENQSQHLQKINEQLQAYLVSQYKQQQKLHDELSKARASATPQLPPMPEPPRPPDELSNFLYARGLLDRYQKETGKDLSLPMQLLNTKIGESNSQILAAEPQIEPWVPPQNITNSADSQLREMYADGMQEVFGKRPLTSDIGEVMEAGSASNKPAELEINPIHIAYSKLPQVLRRKKFGLPKPSLPVWHPVAQKTKQPEPAH